jgi:hypothetical protein
LNLFVILRKRAIINVLFLGFADDADSLYFLSAAIDCFLEMQFLPPPGKTGASAGQTRFCDLADRNADDKNHSFSAKNTPDQAAANNKWTG